MKVLLVGINAKYIHSNPALYSLYAYAESDYADLMEIAEFTINQKTEDILAQIYEKKPDVIGISCYIWNWNLLTELLPNLSEVLPDTDIWLGGPQVSYNAVEVYKELPSIKGVIIGEGEVTFKEILDRYSEWENEDNSRYLVEINNENATINLAKTNIEGTCVSQARRDIDFTTVAGLYLPSGYTAPREITDLSKLPFLYKSTEAFANRILYYETSRGCPYRCSYCLSAIDKTVRLRDIEIVKKELNFFLENKVRQVKFVDRTFNCIHEHAMAIWKYLYEHDNGVTNFHFEISADIIRDDEIKLLQQFRPGHIQLEIGVQSTNAKTLEAINRRMDLDRLKEVVAAIKKNKNIHQHLDLIAGLPYEDYESFKQSFDDVYAMRPDQLQLGFLKVLSGAPISKQTKEYGIAYTKQPPYEVLYTKWLPYKDVIRLKKIEEMVELYYNSCQFINTLEYLVRAFDSAFLMYEKLADFYEENGYFTNSPSRVYRYEILLNFATKYDARNRDIYIELLTYDLYLRENMKSRPAFCKNINDDESKAKRREFYQEEEKERKHLPNLSQYDSKQLAKLTHFESFKYPVWDIEALLQSTENATDEMTNKAYILFDYSRRNPLSNEAKTIII
ncbi:MAG: B12-binding domain-containing radical SAM protein [Lachnospiraceae bacterium]|nr:B12-binding domain-containing radical SAM protein [Lachnospiraceae bacterium]